MNPRLKRMLVDAALSAPFAIGIWEFFGYGPLDWHFWALTGLSYFPRVGAIVAESMRNDEVVSMIKKAEAALADAQGHIATYEALQRERMELLRQLGR